MYLVFVVLFAALDDPVVHNLLDRIKEFVFRN